MLTKIGFKILFSKCCTLRVQTRSYISHFIIELMKDFFAIEILDDTNAVMEECQCWPRFSDHLFFHILSFPTKVFIIICPNFKKWKIFSLKFRFLLIWYPQKFWATVPIPKTKRHCLLYWHYRKMKIVDNVLFL